MKRLFAGLAASMFLLAALPAQALITPGQPATPAVNQWQSVVDYCERHGCGGGEFQVLPYTDALMALLRSVNRQVNAQITYRRDAATSVRYLPAYGDCDDYAFSKQSILLRHGLPPGALAIVMNYWANDPSVGMHATTAIATDRGTILLSNGIDEPILVDTPPSRLFVHERYGPMMFVGYIAGDQWFTPADRETTLAARR